MNWSKLAPSPTSVLLLAMAFIVTMAGAVAQNTTSALFTDIAVSTDNTFTSGTLDVRLSDTNTSDNTMAETEQDNVSGSLTFTNMVPSSFRARPLTVKNSGTLAYSYTVTGEVPSTNTLSSTLTFRINRIDTTAVSGCESATSFATVSGLTSSTEVFSNTLTSAASATVVSERLLDPTNTDAYCLQVLLPSSASTDSVGLTSAISLTVSATQQRNR